MRRAPAAELTPLHLAAALAAVFALTVITCAWQWSTLLRRGERPTPRAAAVCAVGMSTVRDRRGLGMPGAWLAALAPGAVLVAVG